MQTPLFEVDSLRILADMFIPHTQSESFLLSHYRVNAHPLYMTLFLPYALLLKQLMGSAEFAALLMGCIAGAAHAVLLFWLLCKAVKNKIMAALFTLIGAGSFASVFFSIVPESFVYGGLFLLAYICWLYPLLKSRKRLQMTGKVLICFIFFGLTSFGITITNYAFYVWGLILFISLMEGTIWQRLCLFMKVNLAVLACSVALSLLQWAVFGVAPWFDYYGWQTMLKVGKEMDGLVSSVCHWLYSLWPPYGPRLSTEKSFMDFSLSAAKLYAYFSQVLVSPLVAPATICTGKGLVFSVAPMWVWGCLFSFLVAIPAYAILKFRKIVWNPAFLFLFGIVAAHLCLHFIYGYSISFLYSFHFLAAFLVILAISYDNILNVGKGKFKMLGYVALGSGGFLMLANSMVRYMDVVEYCRNSYGIVHPLSEGIFPYMAASFIVCCCAWLVARWLKNREKNSLEPGCFLRWGIVLYVCYILISLPVIFFLKMTIYNN